MDETPNRSSVEVEQILPCTEHGLDPWDYYASDFPTHDECFNSGQGLGFVDSKVQDDDLVESIITCHVCFLISLRHFMLIAVKYSQQP